MQIVINGKNVKCASEELTYDEIVQLAGYQKGTAVSVTWSVPRSRPHVGDMAMRGESVQLRDGMVFNAMITGNA